MKQQLDSQEIKKILLDILSYFHNCCQKHGLRYFLDGGTLIGAVRHKGFIPWDDDIDVIMPRDDYEKLRRLYQPETGCEHFILHDYRTDETSTYPFLKLSDERTVLIPPGKDNISPMGIFIDIFPLDGMPETRKKVLLHARWISFLRRCAVLSSLHTGVQGRHPVKSAIVYLVKHIPVFNTPRFWNNLIDKTASKYPLKDSRYAGNAVWGPVGNQLSDAKIFDSSILIDFENYRFFAVEDYNHYLTVCYGDYMTPPPPEKRFGEHIVDCYRKSAP